MSSSGAGNRVGTNWINSAPASRPLARLEPSNGTYFGVNLDWSQDTARAYAERRGRSPAVYVAFAHVPIQAEEESYIASVIDEVEHEGGMALLTLEPSTSPRSRPTWPVLWQSACRGTTRGAYQCSFGSGTR